MYHPHFYRIQKNRFDIILPVEVVNPKANLTFLNLTIFKEFRDVFDGSSQTDVVIEEVQKRKENDRIVVY